jgi:NifU-like protein involved in Fe-S cluster formation
MVADDYHYNETVLAHIADPHNIGEMEDADGVGRGINPACGDEVTLYLKFDGDTVSEARMEVLGCGAITAAMSSVTDLAAGKAKDELAGLTHEDIAASLGGLPKHKRHCAQLAQRVLRGALENRG